MPCRKKFSAISMGWYSSGLFILAAPGWDHSVLAWVALVPLLLALRRRSVLSGFCLAWAAGFLAYAGMVHWVTISGAVTVIEFILIAGYLGLHWGLFGAALTFLAARTHFPLAATAPILWVTCEYLRANFFPLELPWTLLGHSQYQNIALIQLAAVTGLYGISAAIALVNSIIAEAIAGGRHPGVSAGAILVVVGLALVSGQAVLAGSLHARTVPVTVVPGNLAQDVRWEPQRQETNFRTYMEATIRASNRSETALIVWPETSVPGPLNRDLHSLSTLQSLAQETGASLLIGTGEREKFSHGKEGIPNRYNSAVLFSPGSSKLRSYHKMQLLPFGEYLPWAESFPWPARYRAHSSEYAAGKDYTTLSLHGEKGPTAFGVLICWEGIFPNLARQFVQQGAAFLVGISNEAWFDGKSAPQFLAMNTFRAVENRRSLVRAVNGGISGFIDPYGRLVASINAARDDHHGDGFLTYTIEVLESRTFYTSYGDLFAQTTMGVALLFMLAAIRRPRLRQITDVPGLIYADDFGKRRLFMTCLRLMDFRKVAQR